MRINNNLIAFNTHRQYSVNTLNVSKSVQKLSSGLRINSAADDSAGLAISEKMRAQIRGLSQATRNSQDGISLLQTAEGALSQTHTILQRMHELAVQSSSDTNASIDRNDIQAEVNQLAMEITDIANQTQFNGKKLFNGALTAAGSGALLLQTGANAGDTLSLGIGAMDAATLGVSGNVGSVTTTTATGSVTGGTSNLASISFGSSLGSKITNGAMLTFTYSSNAVTISDGNAADDQTIAVSASDTSFTIGTGNYQGLSVSLMSGRHVSDLTSGDDGVSIALSLGTASSTVDTITPNVDTVSFGGSLGSKITNGANLSFTYNGNNTVTISDGNAADDQTIAVSASDTSFTVGTGNYQGLSVSLASGRHVSDLTSGDDGVSIVLSIGTASGSVDSIPQNLDTVSFGGTLGSKILNGATLSFTYNGNNTVTISNGNSADDQTVAANGTTQSFTVGTGNYQGLSVSLASGRHVSDLTSGDDGVTIALSSAATGTVDSIPLNLDTVSFGGSLGSKITNGSVLSFTYNGNNTLTISNGNSADDQTIAANGSAQSFTVNSGNYQGLSVSFASGRHVSDLTSGDDGASIALSRTATGSVIPLTPTVASVSVSGSLGSKLTDGVQLFFIYNGDNTLTITSGDWHDDQTIAVNGTAQSFTVSSGNYQGLSVNFASGKHASDLKTFIDGATIGLTYSATGTVSSGTSAVTTLVKTDGANITSTVTGSPAFKTDGEDITLTYTAGNPGSPLATANLVGLKATTIDPISESSSIKIDIYENGELMATVDGYEMAHGNAGGHYAITDGYKMSRLLMFDGVDTWYDNPPATQWGIHTLNKGSGMSVSVNITGGTAAERAAVGSLMGMTSDSVTVYGTDYVAATPSTVTIADGSGHSATVNVADTDTTLTGTGYFSGLSVSLLSGKSVTDLNGGAASTISFDNVTTPATPVIVDTVSFDSFIGNKIVSGANLTFTYDGGSGNVLISDGNPADDQYAYTTPYDNTFHVNSGNYQGLTVTLAAGKQVSDLTSGTDGVKNISVTGPSVSTAITSETPSLASVTFGGDLGSKITNGAILSFIYNGDNTLTISDGNAADNQTIAVGVGDTTFTVNSGNYMGLSVNLAPGKYAYDLQSGNDKATLAVSAPTATGTTTSETAGIDSVSFGSDLGTKVTNGANLSFTYNGGNTLTISNGNSADDQTIAVNASDTSFTVGAGNYKGLTVNIASGKTASDLTSGNDRTTVALGIPSVTGSVTSETAGLASVSFSGSLGSKVTDGANLSFTYNGDNTVTISDGNTADDQTIAVNASDTSFTVDAGNYKGLTVNLAAGKTASDLTSGNDAVTVALSAPSVTGSVSSETAGLASVSFGSDPGSKITNGANLSFTYNGDNTVTISDGNAANDQTVAVAAAAKTFTVGSGNYKGTTVNIASGKTAADLTSGNDRATVALSPPSVTGSLTSETARLASVSFGSDLGDKITNGANLKFTYSAGSMTISNGTPADDQTVAVNAADTSFTVGSGNYKGMTVNLAPGKTVSDLTSGNDGASITLSTTTTATGAAQFTNHVLTSDATCSSGIDVSTHAAASAAISAVNTAINKVSTQRANLGAYQNRLEHKINNLDTSSENLQAAESRIRDVDMADEMTRYTKNNILVQAATAMLAQANQSPQNVLKLLQ